MGEVTIVTYMSGDGIGTAYGVEGMSKEEAIGRLTIVLDRLREEVKLEWDTCPACKRPWSEHDEDDEEEEDGLSS